MTRRATKAKPRSWLMWGRVWEGRIYQKIWEEESEAAALNEYTERVVRIRITEIPARKRKGRKP